MNEPYLSIEGPATINEGETCNFTHKLHFWFTDPNTGETIKATKEVNVYWSFPKKRRVKPTRAQSRHTIRRLLRRA